MLPNASVTSASDIDIDSAIARWAEQLGCSAEELLSSMSEAGRVHFEQTPTEQYELDLDAPA
jgi:hypothetical protein